MFRESQTHHRQTDKEIFKLILQTDGRRGMRINECSATTVNPSQKSPKSSWQVGSSSWSDESFEKSPSYLHSPVLMPHLRGRKWKEPRLLYFTVGGQAEIRVQGRNDWQLQVASAPPFYFCMWQHQSLLAGQQPWSESQETRLLARMWACPL